MKGSIASGALYLELFQLLTPTAATLHCAVMMGTAPTAAPASVTEKLATVGFRLTPQRQHVYQVLLDRPDHPTAEEVFLRAKETRPEISLATVYNCLDALVRCRLVKQVTAWLLPMSIFIYATMGQLSQLLRIRMTRKL